MSCPTGFTAIYSATADNTYVKQCIADASILTLNATAGDKAPVYATAGDVNVMWLIIAACLVFFMQAGFSMLEAGSVRSKNTINILFKNILDACIGAICFWGLGYGFAYGTSAGGFIGTDNFFMSKFNNTANGWESWFFQFAFAATAATIVSGSVAERTKINAYFAYSVVITSFIYPVVVHWGWGSGFLSAWGATDGPLLSKDNTSHGMIDFAGSGIVHMVGGFAGLAGAVVVGPRKDRFETLPNGSLGKPRPMPGHSMVLCSLGVVILWFGWYGFNAGSTLCAQGCMDLAAKVCVTTTLSAAAASLTATFLSKLLTGAYDLSMGLNAVIAGLVSITAPCPVVEPWAALVIGIIGAIVYVGSAKLLLKLHIDDPLEACPLHGFCGIWGVLSVGIFATDSNVAFAAYPNAATAKLSGDPQFVVQLIGVICILLWTLGTSFLTFFVIDKTIGMRVSEEIESQGLDSSEHGANAYYGITLANNTMNPPVKGAVVSNA